MRRSGKIALGCLLAPIGIITLTVILFMGIRVAGVPEPEITDRHLTQDLRAEGHADSGTELVVGDDREDGGSVGNDRPRLPSLGQDERVRVIIDMEEGAFQIVPGPADEGIQVDAEFDEASYELVQGYDMDKEGRPVYKLRFRSKVSFLRRIAQDGNFDDEDIDSNTIRLQIPRDVPMDLALKLSKAEAEIDLSGLALKNAGLRFNMGEFRLEVDEENPLSMDVFDLSCGMGEFRLNGLSRLKAGVIRAEGSMGEVQLDLDGALLRDTSIDASMKLGELRLRLPDDVSWAEEDFKVTWGEAAGDLDNEGDPGGPQLELKGRIFMGAVTVASYRSGYSPRPSRRDR